MHTKIEKIFDFWAVAEKLKSVKRWKGVPQMKEKETAADHSWQLAVLSFAVIKELELSDLDELKCLKLALVHDLIEAITDDVDSVLVHLGQADGVKKQQEEKKAILEIEKTLPQKSGFEIRNLWLEYEERKSPEAILVHALDKFESVSHMIFMGHDSFHEHADFIATYCHKPAEDFPALRPLHFALQKRLKVEFEKHGWEWKKEYEASDTSGELLKKAERILNFAMIGEKLKTTRRYSTVDKMMFKESTADHSWNLALASFIIVGELQLPVDVLKSIKIALFHDIAESITGDVDYSLVHFGSKTKESKHEEELEAMREIAKILDEKIGLEIFNLWQDYENSKTSESKFIKALDKIEGINHMLVLGYECFDYPELIAPYPIVATLNYPPSIPLLRELHKRLKPEFKKCNWEWKEEYNVITHCHCDITK